MIYLASDNFAPAHPAIIKAIVEANTGYAKAYGSDPWTQKAEELVNRAFGSPCKAIFVPTGTASNVLALKIACKRYESVICSDIAHMQYQESGAAESIVGCKLLLVPHANGKITPEEIIKKLKHERAFGHHSTSPRVLSLTQPTEVGTVYTLSELKEMSALCQEHHLLLHIDGSRLYNAMVHLDLSFQEMIRHVPIDLLSLGGTKNGLMSAEVLVIFNSSLLPGSDHLQKQTLQLLSKMRYLSAQFIPFFEQDLWQTLASHANQKAQQIASFIESNDHLSLSYPVETNQIFFTAPRSWIPHIQEHIACYLWNEEKSEIRLITSWCTTEQEVEKVSSIFKSLSG
jgi:threonine aldolase